MLAALAFELPMQAPRLPPIGTFVAPAASATTAALPVETAALTPDVCTLPELGGGDIRRPPGWTP